MRGLVRSRPDPFVSALPIFPGRHQPSIFGASELNCRVRDGNGWTLTAISTDCVDVDFVSLALACGQGSLAPSRLLSNANPLRWALRWAARLCRAVYFNRFSRLKSFFSPEVLPPQGSGTPSGTRTLDTLIKSQVLYQLS